MKMKTKRIEVSIFLDGMEEPLVILGNSWDECLDYMFDSRILRMTEYEVEEEN